MKLNTKTVILAGAEQEVKLSGHNCDIRNDGTDTVYASGEPNITAGADGVISIPSGQAVKLLGCNGNIYLLGTGSVQLCGNDYAEQVFKYAPAGGGSGTVDQTARNTINAHANNTDIHLTTEDAIEAAATVISNPNLLINPDFKINQRGQAEYSRVGYTVDMWRMYTNRADGTIGAVTLTGGYVDLTSNGEPTDIYFSQYIENGSSLIGRIVTLSFKASELTGVWGVGQWAADNISVTTIDADGIASVSFVWQKQTQYAIQFFNRSSDAVLRGLEWVKLELGSVATPFAPPDPATELARCQRYYQIRTTGDIDPVDLRPSMYSTTPTITSLSGGKYVYSAEP